MLNRRTAAGLQAGFTLIEVLVGLAILAIMLSLGMPAFSNYLGNARLRASASSLHAAAQLARTEAIRRNTAVELILTDDAPTAANQNTVNLSTTGQNWIVRAQDPGAATFTLLQGRSAQEGGNASVVVTGTVSRVTFNGLGRSAAGAQTFRFTSTAGACADVHGAGPMRCLDVRVAAAGQARLCDPVIATAGDSRGCS
jgi:type IV fimbrial biogenesis protein FimT